MQLILLTLAPLLAFALAENVQANITNITNITTPKQVGKPIVCKVKRVRKEVREMKKDGDFEGFVKAFNQLLVEGEMGKFESIHVNDWDYKHMSPRFLPWHRMFLHDLEEKLIARGAKYLPYWDWSLDAANPSLSPVWSSTFLGQISATLDPNGEGEVINGPFKFPKKITRKLHPLTWDNPATLNELLNNKKWSWFSMGLEMYPFKTYFSPHNLFHINSGIGTVLDPGFWFHHAFIDKVYEAYQNKGHQLEFDTERYDRHRDLTADSVFEPFGIAVKSVFSIRDMCYSYAEVSSSDILHNKAGELKDGKFKAPKLDRNTDQRTKHQLDVIEKNIHESSEKVTNAANIKLENGEAVASVVKTNDKPLSNSTVELPVELPVEASVTVVQVQATPSQKAKGNGARSLEIFWTVFALSFAALQF